MNPQSKAIVATAFGTMLSVLGLTIWYNLAPQPGSGWVIFFTFFGTLGIIEHIKERNLSAIMSIVVVAVAGPMWYLRQGLDDAWAVGLLAIAACWGFVPFVQNLMAESTAPVKKSRKKNK